MAAEECPLSELPPDQCACPNHRGGTVSGIGVGEPLAVVGPTFVAVFPGRCVGCDHAIEPNESIRRVAESHGGGYAHAPRCTA